MSEREDLQLARKRDRLVSREVYGQLSLEGYFQLNWGVGYHITFRTLTFILFRSSHGLTMT